MKPAAANAELVARLVACPSCGGPSVYAPGNAFRPFCSERCKQIDLGAWASEAFVVPAQTEPDDSQSAD